MNDIRSCVRFRQQMADAGPVVVDAATFQSGDVTCIQILLAAAKSAGKLGGTVEVVHAGPALLALLSRCGVDAPAAGLHFRQDEDSHEQDGIVRR